MRTLLPYLLLSCMAWGQTTFPRPLGPILVPDSVDGFLMDDVHHGHRACHKGDRAGYVADTFACCFALDDGETGGYGCWKYSEEKSYGVILDWPKPIKGPECATPLCPAIGHMFDAPKPEPMDVPAIKETPKIPKQNDMLGAGCVTHGQDLSFKICVNGAIYDTRSKWTCADKSRILLTAEDGTRHCVKF